MINLPPDLKYAATHEWVNFDGQIATVGLSDYAQQELTDVVFVELPEPGRQVAAGESCAVVESVKTASDIYSPVTGVVLEINPALADDPARVNSDPYGAGWFFKVKTARPEELENLLTAAAYQQKIDEQA